MLLPHALLVLAVDGQNARLMRNSGAATDPCFEVIRERHVENPPDRELMADRPGRAFASATTARHAYQENSAHDRAEAEFAAQALDLVDGENAGHAPVVLIAPPRILGVLRSAMSRQVRQRVIGEIPKDLLGHRPAQISAFLSGYEPVAR